jgi:phosphoribosylglycinamide formyltransferase-1
MKKIVIFASGTGSNFETIAHNASSGVLPCEVSLLVSDKPSCKAITKAKSLDINIFSFNPKDYKYKKDYEEEIVLQLQSINPDLIVLAGYMRLIGPTLLKQYEGKIVNIHPSLLPKYKGKDAVGQALSDNADETGVTVHYVDNGMDTGQIIDQVACPIFKVDTRDTLEQRIHAIEHKLYTNVIKKLLEVEI